MAISTFDTHKFVRRLEEAGMPLKLAEVQAEVLTEAFNVNLDSLVTKDFLAARFAEQKAFIDTRFAEQEARWENRFIELKAYVDTGAEKRLHEQNARWDGRFNEQNARWEERFAQLGAKVDSNHRVFVWTQAIILAVVILPLLERLMAL